MERGDAQRQRAATNHLHGLEGTSPDVHDRALLLQLDWSNYLKDNERIFSGVVQLALPFLCREFHVDREKHPHEILCESLLEEACSTGVKNFTAYPLTYPLPEFGENRTARGGRKPSKTFNSIRSHPGSEQVLFTHPPEVCDSDLCV